MIEGIERNETVSLKRKVIAAFGGHRLETVPLPKLRKLEGMMATTITTYLLQQSLAMIM